MARYARGSVSLLVTLVVLSGLCLVSFTSGAQAPARLPREQTLYMAGHQWGPPTSFSPFIPSPAWPITNEEFIYETLFAFNLVTGKLDPIVAESYKWVDKYTLTITLREGTHWQDGRPLTSKDVVYTFELGKKYVVSFSPIWDYVNEVTAVDDRTVRLKLNPEKPHRGLVENYIGQIRIAPQHVWSKVEAQGNLIEYTNLEPIGSGPYKLLSFSPEQIVLERDDNYWGIRYFGKVAPKYVVHPIFKSNDAGNLAFERAEVDLSQQFCPEVWKMWEVKKLPVGTWYDKSPYYIPASIPSLFINLHRYPLSLAAVRRALAYSIDYAKIAETAMSRYSPPASSSLIIPVGVPELKYFNAADVEKFGWEYNPQKSVEIFEKELKAKKGTDGIYVLPDGTRLGPFTMECPYGWTDWMTSLEVVSVCAKKVGIEIRTQYPDQPVWNDHRNTGNFDFLMDTPAGGYSPAHPWIRFRDVMDSRGIAPIGQVAYRNYGRYSDPEVCDLLDEAAGETDEKRLAAIYGQLNRIFMRDIPIIPLEYRPWEFFEYNETYWAGFPNEKNPTAPPQHNYAGIKVFYVIKPKK